MSRIPLNTLPTFCSVARLQNLRLAAERLHLTHSAVSQQIKLLESQIGFELFHRRGRRVLLNEAGEALLQAVAPALAMIDDAVHAARAVAGGSEHTLLISVLPSFAQRWMLPRMGRWRERHPTLTLGLHTSQQIVDLGREGMDAAIRQGAGPWPGLQAECLIDSPLIAVGAPAAAERLHGRDLAALANEPLLGSAALWARWFALGGVRRPVQSAADFNDAGLMLQAAEQGLGIALARDLLAADALHEGRLVRLSALSLPDESARPLWLVYPTGAADSAGIVALRDWLRDELETSQRQLDALATGLMPAAETSTAGPTGSRSPGP